MNILLLNNIHNILRWVVLLFGLLSIFTGLRGLNGKRDFNSGDKRTALYFLISCDLQLLLGLSLYFSKGYLNNFSNGGMATTMKDPIMRFWTVEHSIGMLLAIILVHVGYAGIKGNKAPGKKFSRLFWCSLIAMLIFVVMAPWPFRIPGIARPWVPGMGV